MFIEPQLLCRLSFAKKFKPVLDVDLSGDRLMKYVSAFCVLLTLTLLSSGCPNEATVPPVADEAGITTTGEPVDAGEVQHDEAPHGGQILDLGDYHAEITVGGGQLTVYILGDDAQTAAPLEGASVVTNMKIGDERLAATLIPSPLEDDPAGQSSRFVSEPGAFSESVTNFESAIGFIIVMIGEKELSATIGQE